MDEVAGVLHIFEVHGSAVEFRPRHDVVACRRRQPQMPAQSEVDAPSHDQRRAIGRDSLRIPGQVRTEFHPAGASQQVGREHREATQAELRLSAVPPDALLPGVLAVGAPPVEAAQPYEGAEIEAGAEARDVLILDAEAGIEGLLPAEGLERQRGARRRAPVSAVAGPIQVRSRVGIPPAQL